MNNPLPWIEGRRYGRRWGLRPAVLPLREAHSESYLWVATGTCRRVQLPASSGPAWPPKRPSQPPSPQRTALRLLPLQPTSSLITSVGSRSDWSSLNVSAPLRIDCRRNVPPCSQPSDPVNETLPAALPRRSDRWGVCEGGSGPVFNRPLRVLRCCRQPAASAVARILVNRENEIGLTERPARCGWDHQVRQKPENVEGPHRERWGPSTSCPVRHWRRIRDSNS